MNQQHTRRISFGGIRFCRLKDKYVNLPAQQLSRHFQQSHDKNTNLWHSLTDLPADYTGRLVFQIHGMQQQFIKISNVVFMATSSQIIASRVKSAVNICGNFSLTVNYRILCNMLFN